MDPIVGTGELSLENLQTVLLIDQQSGEQWGKGGNQGPA